ncbi:MAG: ribosomal protein L7/L12, partial [Patescibacteria group bacterium]
KEAKDLTEATPAEIATDVKKEEAQKAKARLEEAGAKVDLK